MADFQGGAAARSPGPSDPARARLPSGNCQTVNRRRRKINLRRSPGGLRARAPCDDLCGLLRLCRLACPPHGVGASRCSAGVNIESPPRVCVIHTCYPLPVRTCPSVISLISEFFARTLTTTSPVRPPHLPALIIRARARRALPASLL